MALGFPIMKATQKRMNQSFSIRYLIALLCFLSALTIALMDYHRHAPQPKATRLPSQTTGIQQETAPPEEQPPPDEPVDETLVIKSGDTLSSILKGNDFDETEIYLVIDQLKKIYSPRGLRPGQELFVTYKQGEEGGKRQLLALHLHPTIEYKIHVERSDDGSYEARKEAITLKHERKVIQGTITTSLFGALTQQGVPPKVIQEMMQVFIHVVDFQRDIQTGDGFGVVFNTTSDTTSMREQAGHMSFAILTLKGKEYRFYRFVFPDGSVGYFNEKGVSMKKGLLRTPIDGARISSSFGKRMHPTLGYSKMHKGVDFRAPKGTPIMASGDGVIEKIGRWSTYGNYVRIRHNSDYSTAYAHLSRFGKNLRPKTRVRQGQIIGYVGDTGRCSGAHLHYELLYRNKQINPKKVALLPASKLEGKNLKAFLHQARSVNAAFAERQRIKGNPTARTRNMPLQEVAQISRPRQKGSLQKTKGKSL